MPNIHRWTLTVGSTILEISGGHLTMDISWSPFIQARVTIPTPARALLDLLNPLVSSRGIVTLTQTDSVTGVTSTREFDLGVRQRNTRYKDGETDLTLASDEALLQDYRSLSSIAHLGAARDVITDTIKKVLPAATVTAPTAGYYLDYGPWDDTDHWSYAQGVALQNNGRVYCKPNRGWVFDSAVMSGRPTFTIAHGVNLVGIDEILSRDGEWADAVAINYPTGGRADAAPAGFTKMILFDRTKTNWDASVDAANLIRAARMRAGTSIEIRAVTDCMVEAAQSLAVITDDGVSTTTAIAKVTFEQDTDEMLIVPTVWR